MAPSFTHSKRLCTNLALLDSRTFSPILFPCSTLATMILLLSLNLLQLLLLQVLMLAVSLAWNVLSSSRYQPGQHPYLLQFFDEISPSL